MKAPLILSLILLAGCSTLHKPEPIPVIVRAPVVAPKPDPVTMRPVQWLTIPGAFMLDEANFKNLMLNLTDAAKLATQQKAIISFMEKAANDPPDK